MTIEINAGSNGVVDLTSYMDEDEKVSILKINGKGGIIFALLKDAVYTSKYLFNGNKIDKLIISEGITKIYGNISLVVNEIVFPTTLEKISTTKGSAYNRSSKYEFNTGELVIEGAEILDLQHCNRLEQIDPRAFLSESISEVLLPDNNFEFCFAFNFLHNLKKMKLPLFKDTYTETDYVNNYYSSDYIDFYPIHQITNYKELSLAMQSHLLPNVKNLYLTNGKNSEHHIPKQVENIFINSDFNIPIWSDYNLEFSLYDNVNIFVFRDTLRILSNVKLTYKIFDHKTDELKQTLKFDCRLVNYKEYNFLLNDKWFTNPESILSEIILKRDKIKDVSFIINAIILYENLEEGNILKTEHNKKVLKNKLNSNISDAIKFMANNDSDINYMLINNWLTKTKILKVIKDPEFSNKIPMELMKELKFVVV